MRLTNWTLLLTLLMVGLPPALLAGGPELGYDDLACASRAAAPGTFGQGDLVVTGEGVVSDRAAGFQPGVYGDTYYPEEKGPAASGELPEAPVEGANGASEDGVSVSDGSPVEVAPPAYGVGSGPAEDQGVEDLAAAPAVQAPVAPVVPVAVEPPPPPARNTDLRPRPVVAETPAPRSRAERLGETVGRGVGLVGGAALGAFGGLQLGTMAGVAMMATPLAPLAPVVAVGSVAAGATGGALLGRELGSRVGGFAGRTVGRLGSWLGGPASS